MNVFNRNKQIASLKEEIEQLKREASYWKRLHDESVETVDWYHAELQETRKLLASTRRINTDLISGRIQWQDKNTGEWKTFND